MKIIFAGPPNAGKSTLRVALRNAIQALTAGQVHFFFPQVNPDGEGAYTMETFVRAPDEARQLRQENKRPLTREFVERAAEIVRRLDEPLVGIDIGGRISDENRLICRHATHAVLIAADSADETWFSRLEPWRDFCRELGLTILAELHSDYGAKCDQQQGVDEAGIFRGTIHRLDRREPADERPTVIALARHLLSRLERASVPPPLDE
jgi:hypothetical protein